MAVTLKNRWGDLLEDEEELPLPTTTGPDGKGIVTKTEYSRNDKGEVVKKVTRTRTVLIEKRVYKSAVSRKERWVKFGDAARESANDAITGQSNDEVMFERLRLSKQTQEEMAGGQDIQNVLKTGSNTAILGSLKDMLYKKRMERQLLAAKGLIAAPERPPEEDDPRAGSGLGGPGGSAYVPPSLRGRALGEPDPALRRRDENSVRVSNLSEDVVEADLQELFGFFGHIQRIFIARDRETGESRGFAFINFTRREEGQKAIDKLDGHGYDNLILSVGWAAPREPRPQ